MTTSQTIRPSPSGAASGATTAQSSTSAQAESRPSRTWLAASVAAATATLQACGGGGGEDAAPASHSGLSVPGISGEAQQRVTSAGASAITGTTMAGGSAGPLGKSRSFMVPNNETEASRFLQQAQFSASDADIASVQALGYAGWLATQFETPASGPTAWEWLVQRGYGKLDSNNFHFTPYQADFAVWRQLIKRPDAVRQRVALALSEIFAVSANGVDYFWQSQLTTSWWDMLAANALGNFRDLLENATLHPAMGLYLSSRGSQKENAAGRQPDENFAREVMQLMTIGLVRLRSDGLPATYQGKTLDAYTQNDVMNLARVFSGYDFDYSGGAPTSLNGLSVPHMNYTRMPMKLNPALHSTLEAKFLGTTVPAGTDGNTARKMALDTLFNHGNVGPFIAKQLIQRLVTSNPSQTYVQRAASVFADNGSGVRGDIAAVVAAILLDDEARRPTGVTSTTFGHLREPMVRMIQFARTFGFDSARGSWKMYDQSKMTQLAQSPIRSPSIFNFFRPAYTPPGSAIAEVGLVAPEFQIVNESSVSAYINYMQTVVRSGVYVGAPDLPQITGNATDGFDLAPSYVNELPLAHDATRLVNRLNLLLAANQLSAPTVAIIVTALNASPLIATSNDGAKLNRIAAAVLMVMSSYEYLVQK